MFRSMGIDVAMPGKGLDVVVMDQSRALLGHYRRVPTPDLPSLIAQWQPACIALDSPPAFATRGRRRTESFVTSLGLSLHTTPDGTAPDTFPGPWMREGHRVFKQAAECGFPLYAGTEFAGSAFEVYPYGSAVVLSGGLRPPGLKHAEWRREVLRAAGVEVVALVGQDQVDAALAALTGLYALEGRACWEGDPAEGVIVLPCRSSELPASYRRSMGRPVRPKKETPMPHRHTNPETVSKPGAYTHVVEATGSRLVFIAGQVALDKDGNVVGAGDLGAQAEQVFKNLQACLSSVGASSPT